MLWSIHARLHFLRMQGLFRETVLALWAAYHADLKFGRALIRAIQARRLLALVADERVLLPFQDGCPALGGSMFTRAARPPAALPTFLLLAGLDCFCRSSAVVLDEQMELPPAAREGVKVSRRGAEGHPNVSTFSVHAARPAAALPNLPTAC